jgi:hypothetical protein
LLCLLICFCTGERILLAGHTQRRDGCLRLRVAAEASVTVFVDHAELRSCGEVPMMQAVDQHLAWQ